MKYLKKYEDLILEKSTLTQLGVPNEFMKYLQGKYEIKEFNPNEFKVSNPTKTKVKEFSKYPDMKSMLVIDSKEDTYYFLRPSPDWKSSPYIEAYSKGILLWLSSPTNDNYKDWWNDIFKNPNTKEYYILPWKIYSLEKGKKSKENETIKRFIVYFNENVEKIIGKILRKEWYKIRDYVIEYIADKSKDIESFKGDESNESINDLSKLTKNISHNFKLYLSDKYWEYPIQSSYRDGDAPFLNFLKATFQEETKDNIISTDSIRRIIIARIIDKVGYMKLATLYATYLLKKELEEFEDARKKYSLSSIEAEKFNF